MKLHARNSIAFALAASLALTGCSDSDGDSGSGGSGINQPQTPQQFLSTIDTSGAANGIVDLPANAPAVLTDVFARYSQTTIAGVGRIHFLAQTGVADELHNRTRKILEQHLADVAGTMLGADKTAVREALAAGDATFVMFTDGLAADPTTPEVMAFAADFPGFGQLLATDVVLEGSPNYLSANPDLDSTLAVTARFVLDAGGAAMAPLRGELATRAASAQASALYAPDPSSTDVEGDFLGRSLEAWYGIWGHDPRGDGRAGVADEYAFITRMQMENGDPDTVTLLSSFFSPIHVYPVFLPGDFQGTFETTFDSTIAYTHRARYITRVGMTGNTTGRINGNELDGVYQGNDLDNEFEGRGGNDLIEGSTGNDRCIYSGSSTEYLVSPSPFGGFATQVQDTVPNRDGIDQVRFVEELFFEGDGMTINL